MKAAILGTGSWATAFGRHLCHRWEQVVLWGISAAQINEINEIGRNTTYLPEIDLPPNLTASLVLDEVLADADAVFVVVPSQVVREVMRKVVVSGYLRAGAPVISLAKGFEVSSLQRISEVIAAELRRDCEATRNPVAVLLGPSHAEEVVLKLPTAIVLAGESCVDWSPWRDRIAGPFFRVYTNDDVLGVEIASGFKNIIALAAGMADGLGSGDNARGALMTRGVLELARLGTALGGQRETFFGLSGIGDMITTCISQHSRNRNFGEALVRSDASPTEVLAEMVQVVEGVHMTRAALKLSEKLGVILPITKQVHDVLFSGKAPREALRNLMGRQLRDEFDG